MTEDDRIAEMIGRGRMLRDDFYRAYGVRRLSEQAALEELDRREWIDGVRRRLRLVAEVHRCRVWKRGEGDWAARCLRPGCPVGAGVGWAPSQQYALGDALAHAGAFLPLPPKEAEVTELDVLVFDAMWAAVRSQQDAIAAALPARVAEVTELINDRIAGVLPDGMRFDCGPVPRDDIAACP